MKRFNTSLLQLFKSSTRKHSQVCLVMLLISATGFAQTTSSNFKSAAIESLKEAQDAGFQALGPVTSANHITLQELAKKINEEVRFVEVDDLQKPEGALRKSAFYDITNKTVYINRSHSIPSEALKPLALHEALGALGYSDVDYQVSLGLHLLGQQTLNTSALQRQIQDAWSIGYNPQKTARSIFDPDKYLLNPILNPTKSIYTLEREGGANGVGGGGDVNAIIYKTLLTHSWIASRSARLGQVQAEPELLKIALGLHLNITYDEKLTEIHYEWAADSKVLNILVPQSVAQTILQGADPQMDPGIQDIISLLESLYSTQLRIETWK